MKFILEKTLDCGARLGRMEFDRGSVDTPAFMPVGTYGTVKAMTPEETRATGAQIILEIEEQAYGGKLYTCKDIEGYLWNFGTYNPWTEAD